MSYLVLARRWRPQRFADLVGQDVVVRTLRNALTSHSLAHAYLLTGIRGVGKTTIARLMAMSVNCSAQADGEPCGKCDACVTIVSGSHLDVQELDAASHTGVEDMREVLDGVRYPPVSLPYKVYIIDEAHMLSKSAFNALLKTLEEPPAQVLFILATTESEKLPVTVRSRCQRFDLRRLAVQEVADYLGHVLQSESVEAESEALLTIARAADGSVRDALSLTERVLAYAKDAVTAIDVRQALGLIGPEVVQQISDAIVMGHVKHAVELVRAAAMQGQASRALLLALSEQWHQLACMMVDETLIADVPSEQTQAWLQHNLTQWQPTTLDLRYQVLIHGLRDLGLVDEQRGAEMIVLRLCHLKQLTQDLEGKPVVINTKQQVSAVESVAIAAMPGAHSAEVSFIVVEDEGRHDSHDEIHDERADAWDGKTDAQIDDRRVVDLPIKKLEPSKRGLVYASWEKAVAAYTSENPGVAAMLEHAFCLEYGDIQVRLALDAHQQRAIVAQERSIFASWLGCAVSWENKKDQKQAGGQAGSQVGMHVGMQEGGQIESISTLRARQAEQDNQQRWQQAEQDSVVQTLVQEMDCRLVNVLPGTDEKSMENDQ